MGISPSKLPEDIVIDILSRLPVKSLLRFRTISKSWLSIISNPQFIQSHSLITSKKKNPCILASQILNVTPKDIEYIFRPKLFSPKHCDFIGSCNGIVCLADYLCESVCLWNPSTKQYKIIPKPEDLDVCGNRTMGFRYDSISNDYKILRIQALWNDPTIVQLFSADEGFWRKIRVNIQLPGVTYFNCGAVMNGFLYFEVRDENFDIYEDEIISFDLHNEVFGVVPLPNRIKEKRSNVLDFKGYAAIMIIERSADIKSDHQGISLWTLEDCVEVSWIKKFTIEADEISWMKRSWDFYGIWVDFYLGDGTLYGRNYTYGSISPLSETNSHMWYNYENKKGNCFHLGGGEFPQVLKYTESLVSIKGFKSTGSL